MSKKTDKKINIPVIAACILLCLTMISMHMVSGFYAKYTVESVSGDTARVAKFDITENIKELEIPIEIVPNTIDENGVKGRHVVEINVKNSSEVAAKYSLNVINHTKNIEGLEFKLYNASLNEQALPNLEVTLPPNDGTTHIYYLYVQWSHEKALDYMGMVDLLEIIFIGEQID